MIPKTIATVIPDGSHTGIISNVLQRDTPSKSSDEIYSYLAVEIEMDDIKKQDGSPVALEVSAPARLTVTDKGEPNSGLAHLLKGLGYNLDEVTGIEPDEMLENLKGKSVLFMTMNETNDSGTFARVIAKSVKLS